MLIDKKKLPEFKLFVDVLSRKCITRLEFHKEFKPLRRIFFGKSTAVYCCTRLEDHKNFAIKVFDKKKYD